MPGGLNRKSLSGDFSSRNKRSLSESSYCLFTLGRPPMGHTRCTRWQRQHGRIAPPLESPSRVFYAENMEA